MTFHIGTPHSRGAGYFLNDQALARKQEDDVRTCTHCQTVILLRLWKEDGGFCGKCMAPICGPCADRMLTRGCEPFIAKIERALKKSAVASQLRKMAGLDARSGGVPSTKITEGESK